MINKNILSKTKKKLTVFNTLVVAVLFVAFSIFIYSYFYGLTYRGVDKALDKTMALITGTEEKVFDRSDPEHHKGGGRDFMFGPDLNIIYIFKDGKLLPMYENETANNIRPYKYGEKLKEGTNSYEYEGHHFKELKKVHGEYTIEVIKIVDTEVKLLKQLSFVLGIGMSIALLVAYLASKFLTKNSLKPIEATWENQVLFVQDASHELRTPLTIMLSKIESIIKRPDNTIEDEMANLTIVMKEIRRLRKLVLDLLKLTKEDAIVSVNKSKFNIEELVNEVLENYNDIAEIQDKKINFYNNLANNIINSDKEKVKQLLIIFVDNAIKYTNPEDIIDIKLSENTNSISMIIEDTGIGIKEDEINNIFNRFYRSSSLRAKNTEGSGVGLSIAKTVISNLRGNIKVESEFSKGTKFYINIPK